MRETLMSVPFPARRKLPRRLVLGAAFAAGLLAAVALAEREPPDRPTLPMVAEASAAEFVRVQAADPKAKPEPPEAAEPAPSPRVDAEISIGEKGVVIKRRRADRDADMLSGDHEFDSFEQFVERAPWLAGLVFMVTALVFIVPLLVIVLVIWYKMRSNRLRNETMLKLAERGVIAPAAAIDAVATTPASATLQSSPATAPLYEHAKAVQRRAAWSDLRKGVILIGIGFGISLWGLLDDGTPNGFGLVLLFVGIGYSFLWYFEQRQTQERRSAASSDAKGGP
jgi:Domain of unknown function (DUF6249)